MKALVTVNDEVIEVVADNEEELLMLVKDQFVNAMDDDLDVISDGIHDPSRGFSPEYIEELQGRYDTLLAKSERLQRASTLQNVRNLGYDVQ